MKTSDTDEQSNEVTRGDYEGERARGREREKRRRGERKRKRDK